jgi:hypothetical protein
MKSITKEEAMEICRESFTKSYAKSLWQWHPEQITDIPPEGYYKAQEHHQNECWFIPCPTFGSRPTVTAGCPVIGVSKNTGEIVFSGIVEK